VFEAEGADAPAGSSVLTSRPPTTSAHLQSIERDARLPTRELRVRLADTLVKAQPDLWNRETFSAWFKLAGGQLEGVGAAEAPRRDQLRAAVQALTAAWERAADLAAECVPCPPASTLLQVADLIQANWRDATRLLARREQADTSTAWSPVRLLKVGMEQSTAALYLQLPRAFGLPSIGEDAGPVEVDPAKLKALLDTVHAERQLLPSTEERGARPRHRRLRWIPFRRTSRRQKQRQPPPPSRAPHATTASPCHAAASNPAPAAGPGLMRRPTAAAEGTRTSARSYCHSRRPAPCEAAQPAVRDAGCHSGWSA
jgi:hypothetical protein